LPYSLFKTLVILVALFRIEDERKQSGKGLPDSQVGNLYGWSQSLRRSV